MQVYKCSFSFTSLLGANCYELAVLTWLQEEAKSGKLDEITLLLGFPPPEELQD